MVHRDTFKLQNVAEPNLYREMFPYTELPRVQFGHSATIPAGRAWITDTTFRDGQQARPPYSVQQITDLYTLMSRLDGGSGLIRASEFFLYSPKDREAVDRCRELGCEYPQITGWIRAVKADFKLVKEKLTLPKVELIERAGDDKNWSRRDGGYAAVLKR